MRDRSKEESDAHFERRKAKGEQQGGRSAKICRNGRGVVYQHPTFVRNDMGPDIVSLGREWLTDIAPIASRKNLNSGLTSGNEDWVGFIVQMRIGDKSRTAQ